MICYEIKEWKKQRRSHRPRVGCYVGLRLLCFYGCFSCLMGTFHPRDFAFSGTFLCSESNHTRWFNSEN